MKKKNKLIINSVHPVSAVVVTHNRLKSLIKCLKGIESQKYPVLEIIVVCNDATTEIHEWINYNKKKNYTVIKQNNLGSSGGFFTGIKYAYEKNYEWIWCMDDDAVPYSSTLEQLLATPLSEDNSTGFLSSVVLWKDKTVHKLNIPFIDYSNREWLDYLNKYFVIPVKYSSFVSLLLQRRAIRDCGLPLKDLFIWFDDAEYTSRISKKYKGYLVLKSKIQHLTENNTSGLLEDINSKSQKVIYGNRNLLIMIRSTYKEEPLKKYYLIIKEIKRIIKQIRNIKLNVFFFILGGLFYPINNKINNE